MQTMVFDMFLIFVLAAIYLFFWIIKEQIADMQIKLAEIYLKTTWPQGKTHEPDTTHSNMPTE